jgi:signal transduction histidine kinase
LWIATRHGLSCYTDSTGVFSNYFKGDDNQSLSNNVIYDLFIDDDEKIWCATKDGLNIFDPVSDKFNVIKELKTDYKLLKPLYVQSIYEDAKSRKWLLTNGGIVQIDDDFNVISFYDRQNGMKNERCYQALVNNDVLWVATNQGLSRIDVVSNEVVNYTAEDGLQSDEFNTASLEMSDGRFVFGGINGINVFKPNNIEQAASVPTIFFTSLGLYSLETQSGTKNKWFDAVIKSSLIEAQKIELKPDERNFTISFVALDYHKSERVEYYYRMLPNTNDWMALGQQNHLTFIDLSPGEYHLEIRSTDSTGRIVNNQRRLTIVVVPEFWKEAWFIVMVIVCISLIIFFLGRLYYHRIQKDKEILENRVNLRTKEIQLQRNIAHRQRDEIARQKEELERFTRNLEGLVDERTEELKLAKEAAEESDRLKSAFLSNMSHEIRTPMNAIMGFSELLLEGSFSNEEKNDFTKMIRTNGDNLLHLLNDIIDISMIESGQLKISINQLNASTLIHEAFESFKTSNALVDKPNVNLELFCPDKSVIILSDHFRLRQILNNLIGNAIKFTTSGYVKVMLIQEGQYARFSIEDSGIGISLEHQSRIFERFLKIENNTADLYAGNGLGLTITKNLVELLNGKIGLESELGVGTNFFFYLPLANHN